MNHRVMSHDSGVEMVKAMLKHQGKSEKTNNGVSRTSFICATCCPYLPLLGKRCFKIDSRHRDPILHMGSSNHNAASSDQIGVLCAD